MKHTRWPNAAINIDEISSWNQHLWYEAQYQFPREIEKFLDREADKVHAAVDSTARAMFKPKTGNLFEGIKKGKKYTYRRKNRAIRVYAGKPAYHSKLLEYGHDVTDRYGTVYGYANPHPFMQTAKEKCMPAFLINVDELLNTLILDMRNY